MPVVAAHGFFVCHVRGNEMEGIKIVAGNRDERPAFLLRMWRTLTSHGRKGWLAGYRRSAPICAERLSRTFDYAVVNRLTWQKIIHCVVAVAAVALANKLARTKARLGNNLPV